jgi:hypothetical protein
MANFTFNDRLHEYALDGRRMESITQILQSEGFIPESEFIDPYHLAVGTAVHDAVELHLLGNLKRELLQQPGMLDITGYVDSAIKYLEHFNIQINPEEVEVKLYDPCYLYAGRLDTLHCDWKSGGPSRWHVFQIAAQRNLAKVNGYPDGPRRTVYLQEDGSMAKFKEYSLAELKRALDTFLCAINTCRAKREMGI